MKNRLFVDIDGTLAEFRYAANEADLYREGYFRTLKPQKNILNAVKRIASETSAEVIVLSSVLKNSKFAEKEKIEWLSEYFPEGLKRKTFLPCGESKADAVSNFSPGDILLDDYGVNCRDWKAKGGRYVKVSRDREDMEREKCIHKHVISPDMTEKEIAAYLKSLLKPAGGDI